MNSDLSSVLLESAITATAPIAVAAVEGCFSLDCCKPSKTNSPTESPVADKPKRKRRQKRYDPLPGTTAKKLREQLAEHGYIGGLTKMHKNRLVDEWKRVEQKEKRKLKHQQEKAKETEELSLIVDEYAKKLGKESTEVDKEKIAQRLEKEAELLRKNSHSEKDSSKSEKKHSKKKQRKE